MPTTKLRSTLSPETPAPQIDSSRACFRIHAEPSKIHRWGVYADEDIPANRKVIEYTGERISRRETKIRAGRKLNYIFTLDSYWSLDGSVNGSGAEFINHCCNPNLESRIVKGHILYYSKRPIIKGEELTIDYHFGADEETVKCKCGAHNCRGTINLLKFVKKKR
ncbi:MAG: SET domain-containing protein-lysine N-methyltransferase [Bryobacteraceae bacterium]